jgi:serine/threonine protein kinase
LTVEPGTVVARRYRVQRPLGKGGMGEVFAAENTRTGRQVAIKVLRAEAKSKKTAIERFRREARAAGAINSDHVTQVLDVDDDPEHGIVLVFELLEGESLVERLKRTGPIPFFELWGIVEAVWMGLADAHASGIIHRDLKPSNVFLERRRNGATRVKILDFGISKLPKKINEHSLTSVGQSLGTFSFMPPEQIGRAKNVDHRADIYACCTLIFQALTGRLPYQAKNVVAMMELKGKQEPRLLSDVMGDPVPDGLETFVSVGLARDPDDRFQSCIEALERWRGLRPANAMSFAGMDSSSSYTPHDSSPPSLSEAKTLLVKREHLAAAALAAGETGAAAALAAAARSSRMASGGGSAIPSGTAKIPTPETPLSSDGSSAAVSNLAPSNAAPSNTVPSNPPPSNTVPTSTVPSNTVPTSTVPTNALPRSAAGSSTAPMRAASMESTQPMDRAEVAAGMRASSGSLDRASVDRPRRSRSRRGKKTARTYVLLALGAVMLMLVGFFSVAILLKLLGP